MWDWGTLDKFEMATDDRMVAAAFVWLQDGSAAWDDVSKLLQLEMATGLPDGPMQAALAAAEFMRGKGLDWARKGAMGAPWVKVMQATVMSLGQAYNAVKDINLTMRKGSVKMWQAFTDKIHGAATEDDRRQY